jgi:hypothetical protein
MAQKVIILIEDDWELRGNGLGSVSRLQYEPSLFLMRLAKELGMKVNFMVEVLQQLAFKREADSHRNFHEQAMLWDKNVCLMKENGHDVQLHLHPQWHGAALRDGWFYVGKQWNLASYSTDERRKMIKESISYLEKLLRPLDPNYRIHSFKAGSWGLQPSGELLKDLQHHGICIVMGAGKGIKHVTDDFYADYSQLEESESPYYPDYDDIQKVSSHIQPIVVLPLPYYSLGISGIWLKISQKLKGNRIAELDPNEMNAPREIRELSPMMKNHPSNLDVILNANSPKTFDVGNASFEELKLGIDQIMNRCLQADAEVIPLVMQSHTKNYEGNWEDLSRFFRYFVEKYQSWIEFQTFTQFVKELPKLSIKRR